MPPSFWASRTPLCHAATAQPTLEQAATASMASGLPFAWRTCHKVVLSNVTVAKVAPSSDEATCCTADDSRPRKRRALAFGGEGWSRMAKGRSSESNVDGRPDVTARRVRPGSTDWTKLGFRFVTSTGIQVLAAIERINDGEILRLA